ncbi:sugar ABC transporter permease [Bacillaceae bacterium SIJ1]|uniref:carbohydrate ABC transporter permease n=1 Tax=Litoribacterium kuwaitense TaxID=1398745 RepID=UPI0013EA463B|nr:sugar ABC transporter permease [Litoribacterium kuwaitense]NGP46319.1 sugar ABC transporter permease [Litoribacterium kuwaitense]
MQQLKIRRTDWAGWIFSLPLVLGVAGFAVYPMVYAFIMSFQKGEQWVGLSNYMYVFQDSIFWRSLWNTIYMGALSVLLGVGLSFILATLIYNVTWPKWRNFFKAVYFLPNVVSLVATSILFSLLFYPDQQGLLNYFLSWFGIDPVGWFTDPNVARFSIVLMTLWGMLGYNTIIFLAALTSVPKELYEAADVDGGNFFQKWWYVTIPFLKPIIMFMVIIGTINGMKRFTDIWLIGGTAGNPGGSLMTSVLYIYRNAFVSPQMGVATAASYLLFILILGFTLLLLKVNKDPNR